MTKTILVKRNDWGRTRKLSRAHKSNQCRAVCGKALPQYLVGSGASIYLEFAASALKKSAPARESVGRRSSPSLSLTVPHRANPSPREQVCSRPTLGFLSDDIGSMLKGGVEVWQRQLVNEGPVPLVTELRSQFGPRGGDTYSARLQCQPSRSRPGPQTDETQRPPTFHNQLTNAHGLPPVSRAPTRTGPRENARPFGGVVGFPGGTSPTISIRLR
jgi:hypothetical protein